MRKFTHDSSCANKRQLPQRYHGIFPTIAQVQTQLRVINLVLIIELGKGPILLWAQLILTFFKIKLSFGLRSGTGSYFLGTCYLGYRWRVEFRLLLLTLLRFQSYLVPCISARIFIIPKLQNIYCELISLCIEHLPYCYSTRHSFIPGRSLWEHLSRALPTETIFYGLRTIPSDRLFRDYSTKLKLNTLEIIVKWLQVSISECNPRTPQIENPICV